MDGPRININGEEGITSLQIDCGLAASTSLTSDFNLAASTSLTSGSSLTTPKNEPSCQWIDFYKVLKRTPPKATSNTGFLDTVAAANKLLELSDESDFQDKTLQDLTHDQQAILLLMILKGMHEIFEGGRQTSAKILVNALRPESKEYKRMMSFVRKGGDFRCPVETLLQKKALQYIKHFENKAGANAITIFKNHPDMVPFVHVQREDSYICTYNAVSGLLYYRSCIDKGETDDKAIPTIKMNISRYVRDELPGLEIANFTLTTVKGAYLERVLLGLMKSFGTADCHSVQPIPIWPNECNMYTQLMWFLMNGYPFVFAIECFPGLANKEQLEYTGKVADYYADALHERPRDPKNRMYHALLCIGIKPRNDPLPPMLLVQDSCARRPVFEIGLDLLMDMGLENLDLCAVPKKWKFNKNMDYMMDSETKALFCGSPMSIDDKGAPRIINVEKHAQVHREDMSRYLDVIDVKPGDELIVYVT